MKLIEELKAEFEKPLVAVGAAMIVVLVVVKMLLVPWWQWRTETVDYITQQQNNLRPIDVVMANSDQYVSQKEQVLVQSQAWQKLVFSKSIGATEIALQRFIESEATANLLKIQTRRIKSGSINAFLNETVMARP